MFLEEIKALKSGKKELKSFGITIGIVLLIIGSYLLWSRNDAYFYFFMVGAAFIAGGFAFRPLLKPLYFVWMVFAVILGWVMTRVILFVVFYLAVTPIAVIAKLSGKSFLELSTSDEEPTYWEKRDSPEREHCERQF